jgi:hypothetical protein
MERPTMNKPLDTQELPPLNLTVEEWKAGEKFQLPKEVQPDNLTDMLPWWTKLFSWFAAALTKRESQLSEAMSRLSQLEKENAALYSALSDLVDGIEDAGGHDENGDVFVIEDAVAALEMHEKRLPSPPKEAL